MTEVVVSVCWDQEALGGLSRLQIHASSEAAEELPATEIPLSGLDEGVGHAHPLLFALTPSGDTRELRLVVTGLRDGQEVVEHRVDTHFEPGASRQLDVVLEEACAGRLCRAEQAAGDDVSCVDGDCAEVPDRAPAAEVKGPGEGTCGHLQSESGLSAGDLPVDGGAGREDAGQSDVDRDAGTRAPPADRDAKRSPSGSVTEPPPDAGGAEGEDSGAADAIDPCEQACRPGTCVPLSGDDFMCSCPDGFQFVDGSGCQDVDECAEPDPVVCPAPQRCINEPGSYSCQCTGYYASHPTEPGACADPHFLAVQMISSSARDSCLDVATQAGDVLVAGHCDAACTVDGFEHAAFGGEDIIVARLDRDGRRIWSTVLGGTGDDLAHEIAALPGGGVLAVGQGELEGVDLGLGPLSSAGAEDAWAMAFDSEGRPVWQFVLGSVGFDTMRGLAVRADGRSVITGRHAGPVTWGPHTLTHAGGHDFFVVSLDAGGEPEWMRAFGGSGNDGAPSVAIDSKGNIYVAAYYDSPIWIDGLPVTAPVRGGLLLKLDESGQPLWWVPYAGGSGNVARAVSIGADDSVYLGGYFTGSVSFGGDTHISAGLGDGFVARYDEHGAFKWSLSYGGARDDSVYSLSALPDGRVFVAGTMRSDVEVGGELVRNQSSQQGLADTMFALLAPEGQVEWAHAFGGLRDVLPRGIAVDASGDILLCGRVDGSAALLSGGARVVPDDDDAYVLRLRP